MGLNIKKFISDICDKKIEIADVSNANWSQVIKTIYRSKYLKENSTQGLKEFLLHICKKGSFLDSKVQINRKEYLYIQGLVKVFERNKQWINDPLLWKPTSHNRRKQFSHLLKHLFGMYEIPAFMDIVWFRSDKGSYRYRNWYINLSRGESLRKQKSKTLITKKIAKYFGSAPQDYSVEDALWWAIIISLGGNERIAIEFNAASPSHLHEDQEFWKRFIKYIIDNPMIDKSQIGPIIDYINNRKFDSHETYENDIIVVNPPPQPNFSLNNRNPNTLLTSVRNWHTSTSKTEFINLIKFDISKIKPYSTVINKDNQTTWLISQITNNFALYKEGELMGHCVGSYVWSCRNNHCTIWSLSQDESNKKKKLVTIEVSSNNTIVEARGKFNRYPTEKEFRIIEIWAKYEGLGISNWIHSEVD